MVLWDLSFSKRTETEINRIQSFLKVVIVLKMLDRDKIGIKTGVSGSEALLQLGLC